jgi:hypothetical protein
MAEVIKQIKTKSNDSFSSPIYLGAEQRFVGALRGSNVDNLEEQYIIGVDCVTKEEWDDTNHKHTITKEFRKSDQSTNYYKLVIEYGAEQNSSLENGIATISDFENELRNEKLYYVKDINNIIPLWEKIVTQMIMEFDNLTPGGGSNGKTRCIETRERIIKLEK